MQPYSNAQLKQVLKRNEFNDFFENATDWVKGHLENVLIGTVVLAVLGVGAVYLAKNRAEGASRASLQFSSAEQQFNRAMSGGDPAVMEAARAGYAQVQSDYSSRDEAVAAELR